MRINRFCKRHHSSYFSKRRQNLATANETLAAIYIKIISAFINDFIFLYVVYTIDLQSINPMMFMKFAIFIDCVLIPTYWLYSTSCNWKEFWSSENSRRTVKNDNPAAEMKPLVPRGPCINKNKLDIDEDLFRKPRGRFCYL